jgi:hypothetical protein
MEQAVATLDIENQSSNPLVKPVTIQDATLLTPGIWTGTDGQKTRYSPEGVINGYLNTNWEGMNLFLDHEDSKGSAAAYWIGFIRNARMVGDELHGDLEIWHPMFAMFVKTAKAKFGVSMTMNGREDFNTGADYSDFDIHSYRSGSLVDEPGCEASWLPKMLGKGDKNSKTVVGGNVSLENIKALSGSHHINSSEKSLGSNDPKISESSDSETNSDEEDNCKEVEKMTDKVNQKSKEEQEAAAKSEATEEKSEETTEEANAENSTETEDKDDVKELAAKVNNLEAKFDKLTGLVEKSLAAGEEAKAETEEATEEKSEEATEEKAGEESKDDELKSTKSELEETKKELAKAKAEANEPDEKSLAAGANAANAGDANAGMLGFLRKNAHLE